MGTAVHLLVQQQQLKNKTTKQYIQTSSCYYFLFVCMGVRTNQQKWVIIIIMRPAKWRGYPWLSTDFHLRCSGSILSMIYLHTCRKMIITMELNYFNSLLIIKSSTFPSQTPPPT